MFSWMRALTYSSKHEQSGHSRSSFRLTNVIPERIIFVSRGITVLDYKAVDDRLCILRIKTKFHNLCFIKVHALTEDKDEIDMEAFHQKMEEAYDIRPSNDIKVLLGTDMPQSGLKKFTED